MTTPQDLEFDENGIPILTDTVAPDREFGDELLPDNRLARMSVEDITQTILSSESIRHRLDDIAAELTRNVRVHLEQLLRPAIEQAVIEVMEDSGNAAFDSIRQQLDEALPVILADVLREEFPENS